MTKAKIRKQHIKARQRKRTPSGNIEHVMARQFGLPRWFRQYANRYGDGVQNAVKTWKKNSD